MESLSVEFILLYCLYTVFTGFQYGQIRFNLYVETCRKTQEIFIKIYAIAGIAFQYMVLIYLGFSQQWYIPVIFFVIGMIVEMFYAEFEKIMGLNKFAPQLYLVSFFCIPACGYLIIIELN
ncbi:MAG: hypothetical protein OMM_06847 [Candidatus Magnetoglobus multicellularis str. Araruama]|uniref:Uncharacterized protein n=1 Tax=Candidatus Magnetoglobus multicellularis str. Araruama TaxID=890399 RepID=A0A1V1PFQ8_9BACT|nr:MAG: hypothetical protein OMM_06847 [Candidatus Magnetoglobus multicellularis str. Araruama]